MLNACRMGEAYLLPDRRKGRILLVLSPGMAMAWHKVWEDAVENI